ncbi:MAG: ACP S-malonyltransferase [Gemmatimonadota bacterium]|nr:MAG: ACP S-malonyltransferase [Gemmatimonadota bacterium]
MGKDIAEQFPEARSVFGTVDEALGVELSALMWEGPESELTLTHNAQPAILAHTLAVAAVVESALSFKVAAGHSLGEYSAYQSAGSLELADAARLVRKRGELMLGAGQERSGTMTAVLGLEAGQVERLCQTVSDDNALVVAANINAPDQTVISGDPDAVRAAEVSCKEAGARRLLPLKVSGAFHSPLMAPAEVGLRDELSRVRFCDPRFPIIANASGEPVTDADTARALLGAQLTSPVRWAQSMVSAAQQAGAGVRFVELGPGKVLSGLLRRIVPEAESISLGKAADINRFLEEAG